MSRPISRLRLRLSLTALPLLMACPALADSFRPAAPVSAVVLFPSGAEVTRQVSLDAPAGRHQVIVTGLPQGFDAASLRISASGGQLGSFVVQDSRALPDTAPEPAPVVEARAALNEAEAALAAFDEGIAVRRAEAEAKADMIAIFKAAGVSPETRLEPRLIEMATELEGQLTELRRDVIRIEAEIAALAPDRRPHQRAVDAAQAALEAVLNEQADTTALVLDVATTGGAPLQLTITSMTWDAGWEPAYDLRLDSTAGTMSLERGAMLRQQTGEDWSGVHVTLSSARPSGQIAPSEITPLLVRAVDPAVVVTPEAMRMATSAPIAEGAREAADSAGGAMNEVQTNLTGPVVTYAYGEPVDLRSGADALRLGLGAVALPAEIRAKGNAAQDSTAYLFAEADNGAELVLPGPVGLYADGVMVGQSSLPLIAAGDRIEQGFGPIDGIIIERRVPHRRDGERGLIRRANALEDEVQLVVTNRTARDWSLLLTDRAPVAEQDEVNVSWSADPSPDRTGPKGNRGVVEWDLDLAPGAEQVITIPTRIDWPRERELRGYP